KPLSDERPRRIFWRDVDVFEAGRLKHALKLGDLRSAGHASRVGSPVSFDVVRKRSGRDHVYNGEPSTWFQHAERFVKNALFLGREIDYAIGNDHIDTIVSYRQRFDFTQPELNVCKSVLLRVFARFP